MGPRGLVPLRGVGQRSTNPWQKQKRTGQTGRVPRGIDPGKVRSQALAKMLAEKSIDAPAAALGSIPVVDEKVALKKKIGDAKGSKKHEALNAQVQAM